MASETPARFLCLCAAGLEDEAAEATRTFLVKFAPEHAGACTTEIVSPGQDKEEEGKEEGEGDGVPPPSKRRRIVVLPGTAAVGKVIVTTPRALPLAIVMRLPYFMSILAFAGAVFNVPLDKESGPPVIKAAVRDVGEWSGALTTWALAQDARTPPPSADGSPYSTWTERVAAFLRAPSASPSPSPSPSLPLRFRASVLREGGHAYHRPDLYAVVGAGVSARLGEAARVNLTDYDLEAVAIVLEHHLHVGLVLDKRQHFKADLPSEPSALLQHRGLIATLRPSTAALLCFAARPQPGDVVCDFMAGVGTIPLVAATAAAGPPVLGLGGDLDPLACESAAKNYQDLVTAQQQQQQERPGRAGLARWDARRLPLRAGCLDVAIVDLPFGKKHKVKGRNLRALYGQALRECAGAMRPGGRLLLLAAGARAVEDSLGDRYNAGCWRPWRRSRGQGGAEEEDEQEEQSQQQQQHHQQQQSGASSLGLHCNWAPRPVNVGGLLVHLFLVERTAQPLPERPPPKREGSHQEAAAAAAAAEAVDGLN